MARVAHTSPSEIDPFFWEGVRSRPPRLLKNGTVEFAVSHPFRRFQKSDPSTPFASLRSLRITGMDGARGLSWGSGDCSSLGVTRLGRSRCFSWIGRLSLSYPTHSAEKSGMDGARSFFKTSIEDALALNPAQDYRNAGRDARGDVERGIRSIRGWAYCRTGSGWLLGHSGQPTAEVDCSRQL